jgi:hypothetical protein
MMLSISEFKDYSMQKFLSKYKIKVGRKRKTEIKDGFIERKTV